MMRAVKTKSLSKAVASFAAALLFVCSIPASIGAQGASALTPTGSYSDPAWAQAAKKYRNELVKAQRGIAGKFGEDRIHFLTAGESAAGGLGFWMSPAHYGTDNRYLCIFARVSLPERTTGRAFPDTQAGRLMTIMDAYGKHSLKVLSEALQKMDDPKIAGAGMVFIYAKKPVTAPDFENDAEAMAIFMPRDAVMQFAALRMTVHTLFSKSHMLPVFVGKDQIESLRMYILQP